MNALSKFFLFVCTLFFIFNPAFAQQGNFRNYTVADGLPQSDIYSLFNDSRGYMWIGSEKGVCSFDGIHFVNYDRKSGLKGSTIRAIEEDSYGRLWFGSDNGISIFDGKNFYHLDSTKGLKNPVMSIFKSKNNIFWIGTSGGGAYVVQSHKIQDSIKVEHINLPEKIGSTQIFSICSNSKGSIFLGSFAGGIFVVNESDHQVVKNLQIPLIPSNHILCLKSNEQGEIWAGTYDKGAFMLDFESKKIEIVKKLEKEMVWDIFPGKNEIWFATNQNGAWRKKENQWVHFDQSTGILANQVLKINRDHEGNMWLAEFGNGLSMFLGDHFQHFGTENGISNRIFGLASDSKGNIWMASDDQGLLLYKPNENRLQIKSIKDPTDFEETSSTCVAIDKSGNIWTDHAKKGICRYNGHSFTYYSTYDGLVNNEVNCIYPDSKGRLWIGTIGGISILDQEKFFNIDARTYGLPNDAIQVITESNDGTIWVGTLNGLLEFSGNSMTIYSEEDGLTEKQISALAVNDSKVWIGTNGGLYCYDKKNKGKKIKKVADDEQLMSSNITGLLFYKSNQLIVASDKGFDILILNKDFNIERIKHYDKMNGFIGVENKNRALCIDAKRNVWFATVKGLTIYNPMKEHEYNHAPKLMLTSIKLFFQNINQNTKNQGQQWIELPKSLSLKYSQNHISFQFIGISFTDPSKVRYRYMLEGLEENLSPPRNVEEVVYSGLKPGKYIFKIISKGSNGIWQTQPINYEFEIEPPFWQKIWFIALVVIISVTIIFSYMNYRERKLKRDKMVLEKTVAERTAEVVKQKNEIEHQNQVLEEQKKEITDSINYAKHIQMALLPTGKNLKNVFAENFLIFKPRNTVSGDFYWYNEKDGNILLVLGDCTGHGVPGAFMSMLGFSYLNQIVTNPEEADPAKILNELRCRIVASLKHEGEDHTRQDGMDMAIINYRLGNDYLVYAGANIPLYKISPEPYEFNVFKPDKMPVGDHIRKDLFKNNKIEIKKGDIFYISSDGFEDQFGGEMNKKFMSSRMKTMFETYYQKPLNEQQVIYTKILEDWMTEGNISQTDDITLMGFKIKA